MGEIKQHKYISVYASNETNFTHNGLRILCPTSCDITEVLNGEYSVSLTHPFDNLGNWKFLREYNIIKVQGQLFRIYRKKTTMSADGSTQRTVNAMHIFYDLNFYYIKSARPMMKNGQQALEWIMNNTYSNRGASTAIQPIEQFIVSSDIKGKDTAEDVESNFLHTAYYEDMTPTKALIGADNCFVNVWGGELIRDNLSIKINKRRGIDNAFNIRYGVDMLEIEEEVDYSDYCGAVYWEGTYKYTDKNGEEQEDPMVYKGIGTLHRLDLPQLPVIPMKGLKLTITEHDRVAETGEELSVTEACNKAVKDYMLANCSPIVNYRVTFADLKNYDLYKDFINLQRRELGDIGTIYNEELGINTTQQIVKKVVDGITGEVKSIELGSLRKTFTSDGRINGGYDSARAELLKNEISYNNTWEDLGAAGYSMNDLNLSWDELAGNAVVEEVDE